MTPYMVIPPLLVVESYWHGYQILSSPSQLVGIYYLGRMWGI